MIHGNLKQNRDNRILHLNCNPGQAILHQCKLARLYSKQGKYSLHDVNLHCRVLFYRTLEVYTKFEIVLERIILAPLKHWTFYAFKPFCCPNILLVDFIVLFSCFFIWPIYFIKILLDICLTTSLFCRPVANAPSIAAPSAPVWWLLQILISLFNTSA